MQRELRIYTICTACYCIKKDTVKFESQPEIFLSIPMNICSSWSFAHTSFNYFPQMATDCTFHMGLYTASQSVTILPFPRFSHIGSLELCSLTTETQLKIRNGYLMLKNYSLMVRFIRKSLNATKYLKKLFPLSCVCL